jgi:glutathione S-transferase
MNNDEITLYYFPCNARAWVIRAMLDVSGVKFKNELIPFDKWFTDYDKSELEYGFLPQLRVNGKKYEQSHAIYYYLGRKLNYLGTNVEEEYETLNILLSYEDLANKLHPYFFLKTDEEKTKFVENANSELLPWLLPVLEKKLANKKTKYLTSDSLTLADIYFAYLYFFFNTNGHYSETASKHFSNGMKYGEGILKTELKAFWEGSCIKEFPA